MKQKGLCIYIGYINLKTVKWGGGSGIRAPHIKMFKIFIFAVKTWISECFESGHHIRKMNFLQISD